MRGFLYKRNELLWFKLIVDIRRTTHAWRRTTDTESP